MANLKMKTPEFRGSFVNLFEPRQFGEGKPKFGLTLALPKNDPFWEELTAAIDEAAKEKFDKVPKGLRSPVKDGDKPGEKSGVVREEWKGCFYVKIESLDRPGVVDADLKDIIDRSEIYSGAYYKATFRPYAWEHRTGGRGVSLGLDNVLKVRDGETFSGKAPATDDFADHVRGGAAGDDDPMG